MARTFDITPLRSLVALAATGGVHRAAQSLALTQSAVSQHLRKLERESGVPLVTRAGRGLAFTPDGEELLSHAKAILAAHDAASARFDRGDRRVIVIGAAQNSTSVIVPMLMTRIRDAFPDSEVRFKLDRSANISQMLAEGTVDVGVTTRVAPELAPRDSGFRLRWLWSAEFPQPAEGTSVPIVSFSAPCSLRQPSFDAFSGKPGGWRVAAEVNDLATGLEAVRAGVGAMLVPVMDRMPDGVACLGRAPTPPAVQLGVAYTERGRADVRSVVTEFLSAQIGAERVETIHNRDYPLTA